MATELYDVASAPPVGEVPEKMHAWLVRADRFGEPKDSFKVEVVDVPEIADHEVLLYVMAAGVNYNNVWAALGIPVNVIGARQKQGEKEDFHIGGSDASGIVYKVGKNVSWPKVGDEVVVHCGHWDANCPLVQRGSDPMYSPTFKTWGYETNYGSFAQFTKVQAHQCVPKPKHLTWEAAAAYMLVGATAYRMLCGWGDHSVRKDDDVLVWGGAGGLGSMAIQICRAMGAIPIAVVAGEDKVAYCESLGAKGCIDRRKFDHWGMLPHWRDQVGYAKWLKGARDFGAAIWDVLGERRSPRLIFEHPGETTIPTSLFVCDTGGMVVICAGTTGYNATVDLRYMWMRQKRVQGSHFANDEQAQGVNDLVVRGLVDPCLSRTFTFDELPTAHQLMHENRHPHGNMAILIGAPAMGTGATAADPRPAAAHVEISADDTHGGEARVVPSAIPPLGLDESPLETEPVVADDGTKVRDLMHRGIVSCSPADTIGNAARLMTRSNIRAVVVIEGGQAVGVVSQTDMVLARQGRTPDEARQIKVSEVMTRNVLTCEADTRLSDAISLMTGRRINRLVVTEGGVPSGIISMTDIIRRTILEDA